jgi:hypothetical protein
MQLYVGDEVLMEIQPGVIVAAFVDEVVEGIVYATGDDGEPYCAPFGNCNKVSK